MKIFTRRITDKSFIQLNKTVAKTAITQNIKNKINFNAPFRTPETILGEHWRDSDSHRT